MGSDSEAPRAVMVQRRLVPLQPGEQPPRTMMRPLPPGMREETDAEFAARIREECVDIPREKLVGIDVVVQRTVSTVGRTPEEQAAIEEASGKPRAREQRQSFEHECDNPHCDDGRVFDRRLYVPGLYQRPGQPERLRVYQQQGECVDVALEAASSEARTAQCTEVMEKLVLTHEQTRWLFKQLGWLVAKWDAEERGDDDARAPGAWGNG